MGTRYCALIFVVLALLVGCDKVNSMNFAIANKVCKPHKGLKHIDTGEYFDGKSPMWVTHGKCNNGMTFRITVMQEDLTSFLAE